MRKMICSIAAALCILTGCSKEIKVVPVEALTVEYGDELDQSKLFDAKASYQGVKVEKVTGFDSKKVGEQTLRVLFAVEGTEVEKEIKVVIKDTKKPTIKLKKDKITITMGDEINLRDNVKTVTDPVDGKLPYSKKEIKKSGFYIDQGNLDLKKTGTYEVKVNAFDCNGNVSKKTFKIIIRNDKTRKEFSSTTKTDVYIDEDNMNQGYSTGNNLPQNQKDVREKNTAPSEESSSVKSEEPKPSNSCGPADGQIGNSGLTFKTYEDAIAWGEKAQAESENIVSYTPMEMYDTCDNVIGYTVSYSYAK